MSIKSELEKSASYLRETRQAILDRGGEISSTAGLKDVASGINTIPPDILTELFRSREGTCLVSEPSTFTDGQLAIVMPAINNAKLTSLKSAFENCVALTEIPEFTYGTVTNITALCNGCSSLEYFHGLDLRNVTNFVFGIRSFLNCTNIKKLVLKNIAITLTVGVTTSYGHLLTVESLVGLIYELRDKGGSLKFTVGSANLDKIANVYVKLIEITDEMRAEDDLIDEKLPFVVCESTDEGAMLITDYVLLKNWKLA